MFSRDIRSERATFRWTSETSRVAFIAMMMIGKIPWNMPKATFEYSPKPNTVRKIGNSVTLGIE